MRWSWRRKKGLTLISPFDEPAIIAGQGTIALEILEELPEVSTVVAPLSGGGLLSGIALALKQMDGDIRTVGVSMDRSPVMYWSLQAGRPVQLPELPTLADSLMGGFGHVNRYTFDLVRQYVDETMVVSEEEIGSAMAYALAAERIVVEGGGAVGIAALRSGRAPLAGEQRGCGGERRKRRHGCLAFAGQRIGRAGGPHAAPPGSAIPDSAGPASSEALALEFAELLFRQVLKRVAAGQLDGLLEISDSLVGFSAVAVDEPTAVIGDREVRNHLNCVGVV